MERRKPTTNTKPITNNRSKSHAPVAKKLKVGDEICTKITRLNALGNF
jgi:hypothetical protein